MKERLIELIKQGDKTFSDKYTGNVMSHIDEIYDFIVDYLLENGAIVPPCSCGDTVYYISDTPINLSVKANTIYEATVARIVITKYGITLVIQIHNSYGCTEIPDMNDWGKTVFPTYEEAQKALKEGVGV